MSGRIWHILSDGSAESHEQFEQRLLREAGLRVEQQDMFSGDDDPPLVRAYQTIGFKIAYQENVGDRD